MFKRDISIVTYILLFLIVNTLLYNYPLFKYALANFDGSLYDTIIIVVSIVVLLFSLGGFFLFLIATVTPLLIFRIFLSIILIANSIAFYFITTYNVILDKSMMGNLFNTRSSEALSFFSFDLIVYILILGILPSIIFFKLKVNIFKRYLLPLYAFVSIIFGVAFAYVNSSKWLWFDKHFKYLGGLALPWSYSVNSIRLWYQHYKKNKKQILLPKGYFKDNKKEVVVLVIGESARAANFSLYGYNKKTNPLLEKEKNLIVLKNSYSIDTYTTASVSAILSFQGKEFDNFEPLPSYLHRLGAYVIWRTKNWGEPKVVVDKYQNAKELKDFCKGVGCNYDEVLLSNLKEEIISAPKNKIFIVLHTSGSHGPTYYKKYYKKFEYFKPVCKSVNLKDCTKEELFNAYDNTIVYTDYFLDRLIGILKSINIPSAMIYISDHGESLGEYGLYLHGTPYNIAPKFQKEIPFLIWESNSFLKERGFKDVYVKSLNRYDQSYIFHTILGLFNVDSKIYDKSRDLLSK